MVRISQLSAGCSRRPGCWLSPCSVWRRCESLRECIHGHVQTCPAEGPDGEGFGLGAVAGGEKSALEELLSTNAAKVRARQRRLHVQRTG